MTLESDAGRKVIVVDDHPFILATVRLLVEKAGFRVIAESSNGIEALQLCQKWSPDLLILDLAIPGLDGLDVIRRLRERDKQCKIVILTSQSNAQFTLRCIQAGASGFVSKTDNPTVLAEVIKAVMAGYVFFPQIELKKNEAVIAKLSNREIMVMKYLVEGLGNKDIALALSLSEKTISTYKSRIFEKLNVENVLALAEFARRNETE